MNNMKRIRREVRLTQNQLASMVGSTQAAISHYETGRRKPSLDLSRDIVNAFVSSGNYAFGSPVNTVAMGYPVPVLYGQREIGGPIISAGSFTSDQQ